MAKRKHKEIPTTPIQRLLLVVFGLLVGVLLLMVIEGGLALLGLGERGRYEDPFVGFEPGANLFELDERAGIYKTNPNKLAFFNAQAFPAKKAPAEKARTYRIFALGGSTTAGRPYDARVAFPRWLELYLNEMDPSRPYEVINAGAISYASYRIALLMRELVDYDPDLFVIYTGHNEFLEERSYSDILHEDPRRRALRRALGRLRGVRLAREGLRRLWPEKTSTPETSTPETSTPKTSTPKTSTPKTLLASEVETKLAGWTGLDSYRRDDALRRSIIEHFEFNLRQMVSIARDHGAEVIFVRPVSNLKDFSPFKSEPGEDGADAWFERGRRLFEQGDYAEARSAFVQAKDADIAPLRALEDLLERLDRVTRESNIALIDLGTLLEDDSEAKNGHRILGNEYLLDHVHLDLPVHSLIAEQIARLLTASLSMEDGTVRPRESWSEARRQQIYDELVASIDRPYYAVRDLNLAKVLGWSGKLAEAEAPLLRAKEILTDEPDLFLNLGILYQKTGRPAEAVRELSRAVELDPTLPEAHFNLGVSRGLLGQTDDGLAALGAALRLRPDYTEARYNLGVLLRRRGDLDAAAEALGQVLTVRPDAAEAHRELGLVHRRGERLDDAQAAFRRALEIDPSDVVARTDLGITLARQGQLSDAEAELRRALEQNPGHAEAHYNLAVILAGRGEKNEAIDSYRRTLEANPEFALAYNNLGILLAGGGELDEARLLLERAAELNPDGAETFLNLGVVYDQLGLRSQAISAVRRASRLEPENPRIRQALELLSADR